MDKNQFGDELVVVTHNETLFENNPNLFYIHQVHLAVLSSVHALQLFVFMQKYNHLN